jgi:predicted HicB family RNase H-like nuclease
MTARKTTAVRFPEDLHARLVEAADERDVSVNWLVVKAVESFLARLIPVEDIQWTR